MIKRSFFMVILSRIYTYVLSDPPTWNGHLPAFPRCRIYVRTTSVKIGRERERERDGGLQSLRHIKLTQIFRWISYSHSLLFPYHVMEIRCLLFPQLFIVPTRTGLSFVLRPCTCPSMHACAYNVPTHARSDLLNRSGIGPIMIVAL